MRVFYFGYFKDLHGQSRFCSPAANNVSSYMRNVLERGDFSSTIINLAQKKKHLSFSKARFAHLSKETLICCPCFGSGRILSRFSMAALTRWVMRFLKSHVAQDDVVVFYHSLNTLKLERYVAKRWKSILQVEEVYTDVRGKTASFAAAEIATINSFDKHIFVSESMKEDPRLASKAATVLYGSYTLQSESSPCPRMPKTIVYAGTLEKEKGVDFACRLMGMLPDYKLFVYGHGAHSRTQELKEQYGSFPNITFFEPLNEESLQKALRQYSFGISPLDPSANFGTTTFPSKILTYMKSGLTVISSQFLSVINSPFKDWVLLPAYDEESFKQSVVSARNPKKPEEIQAFIKSLDFAFQTDLFRLIHEE